MILSSRISKITAIAMATIMLAACANDPYRGRTGTGPNGMGGSGINKADVGTLLGAGLGAAVGSTIGKGKGNIAAIAVGTLLGAGLGNSVGASLDRADLAYYDDTSQRALETAQPGQTLPWQNPQSGNSGTITPSGYYQDAYGAYCREYTQTIMVGNKKEQGFGRACRQPDGSWKIVE